MQLINRITEEGEETLFQAERNTHTCPCSPLIFTFFTALPECIHVLLWPANGQLVSDPRLLSPKILILISDFWFWSLYLLTSDLHGSAQGHIFQKHMLLHLATIAHPPHPTLLTPKPSVTSIALNRQRFSEQPAHDGWLSKLPFTENCASFPDT